MFTVQGDVIGGFCDGISRRNFLKVGAMGLGFGGVGLPDMLRLQASQDNPKPSYKAVINLHLEGGPPQMDTFDMKPDSSLELRGEFSPIRTKVPGTHICELLPNLAKLTDKFTIIRSVIGNVNKHNYDTTQLGYPGLGLPKPAMRSIGGAPSIGGVISKLLGGRDGMPAYVWDKVGGSQEEVQDGWLGPRYAPFDPKVSPKSFEATIPEERLHDRIGLLGMIDKVRRTIDNSKNMEVADQYTQEAVNMVLSGKVAEAMDLTKEPESSRAKYVDGIPTQWRGQTERLMLARRLVEAGARYVSLNWGGYLGFDSHDNNYPRMRSILPPFDMSLSALITDLYERGLDKDVLVVAWGEFGRTPVVNDKAGRDHWPQVQSALVIGGGLKMGQVIGVTDHLAGEPIERPVHVHEVIATIYDHCGINTQETQLVDPNGRPRYLLDYLKPIQELG
tara:strand:+ start:91403 stop:92743 length:1341 start_codon:yes stop_codon:yes gene_type:complete